MWCRARAALLRCAEQTHVDVQGADQGCLQRQLPHFVKLRQCATDCRRSSGGWRGGGGSGGGEEEEEEEVRGGGGGGSEEVGGGIGRFIESKDSERGWGQGIATRP